LKAATNLNVVQPKLFQASRQDDRRFSDCTVSVIQILDDADAAFCILGAGGRFYPRPPCTQTSRAASDDLASSCRTRDWATRAAGYRSDLVPWPETDLPGRPDDVR